MDFVHLHVHTQYSLLDGLIRITALVDRVKELGMPGIAVTDHGSMMGVVKLYESALNAGIKPVIGCEVYVARGSMFDREKVSKDNGTYHLVLLAENNRGYKNLLKIVSLAHVEGFYYKPRVDKELLERYSEGLIALSSCLQGEVPHLLRTKGEKDAAKAVDEYRQIFGADSFFIEIQANGMKEQQKVNEELIALAGKMDAPLVATNDCHYLRKEDHYYHDILLCLQTGKKLKDEERMRFETDQFYIKSPQEMMKEFGHCQEALKNTMYIFERCNVQLDLGSYSIPQFSPPGGMSGFEYLKTLSCEGLGVRFSEKRSRDEKLDPLDSEKYEERLRYELEVIKKTGFAGYFLIVWDFINYARKTGIPVGPGRGSAAGSLVSYCLRITDLDPIQYDLLFERFLNPERVSMPDIDCDFCMLGRDDVIRYVENKYGKPSVSQIITFGTMKARAAIRDVGRVLDIPYADVDRMAKLIPIGMDLQGALQSEPRLRELLSSDDAASQMFDISMAVEGTSRHASTHAAGVVIANGDITDSVPLYKNSNGDITTQFPMKDIEKIGLIKFDFLGLRTLTVLKQAIDLIGSGKGIDIKLEMIKLDDEEVFNTFIAGDTEGIFQCESAGFTELIIKIKPKKLADLIDAVALYRPGPLQSGMVDDYIERKHGRRKVDYIFPQLEPILNDTDGVIIYQEQVMRIARELAGYSMGEADSLRKAIGKKDPIKMAEHEIKFIDGCEKRGIEREKATSFWNTIKGFGQYGFNRSHSAAYALIAYYTAYLKTHFPVEYLCSLLTYEANDTSKVIKYINYCRNKGIEVLPPDVNECEDKFTISDGKIRFGLSAIKNVGSSAIEAIVEPRVEGKFISLVDFLRRVDLRKVNKRTIESLIKSGAFDSIEKTRGIAFSLLPEAMERVQQLKKREASPQMGLFFESEAENHTDLRLDTSLARSWTEKEKMLYEKESLGFYITGHPLDQFVEIVKTYGNVTTTSIAKFEHGAHVRLAGVSTAISEKRTRSDELMAIVQVEDLEGITETLVFPVVYRESEALLKSFDPFFVIGRVEKGDMSVKIIADSVIPLSDAREKMAREVNIILKSGDLSAGDIHAIRSLFSRHKGNLTPSLKYILDSDVEVSIDLPGEFSITPSSSFMEELNTRLGYDAFDLF